MKYTFNKILKSKEFKFEEKYPKNLSDILRVNQNVRITIKNNLINMFYKCFKFIILILILNLYFLKIYSK